MGGAGTAEWPVWTTTARLVVADPAVLDRARELVRGRLDAVDRAASRFRADSEVCRLARRTDSGPVLASPLLAELVGVALRAAERTGGTVDPTLGGALADLGYPGSGSGTEPGRARLAVRRRVDWRDVALDGRLLSVPAGVVLDLGATAKAYAADLCAGIVASRFGCGVLVSLGGDLRVAGPAPSDGWTVLVQDGPDEPGDLVRLDGAEAIATSSTLRRTWRSGTATLHHLLDPVSCRPVEAVWRTVSVAAATCVDANTLSTAAIVRKHGAADLLTGARVAARLVAADGSVLRIGGWPA